MGGLSDTASSIRLAKMSSAGKALVGLVCAWERESASVCASFYVLRVSSTLSPWTAAENPQENKRNRNIPAIQYQSNKWHGVHSTTVFCLSLLLWTTLQWSFCKHVLWFRMNLKSGADVRRTSRKAKNAPSDCVHVPVSPLGSQWMLIFPIFGHLLKKKKKILPCFNLYCIDY